MTAPTPPDPHAPAGYLTRDPVRIVWVVYAFTQGVVIVLDAAEVVPERTSAIVTGIMLAAYVAVSELWVRPHTIPVPEPAETEAT